MVEYSPTPPSSRGPSKEWIIKFVKSISGILKIVEMVLALIVLICAACVPDDLGWPVFTGLAALLQVASSFIVHILNFFPDAMIALVIEMIVYAVFVVFFFGAGINSAVEAADYAKVLDHLDYQTTKLIAERTGQPELLAHYKEIEENYAACIAAAVVCFVCMVIWAVDSVMQLLAVLRKRQQPPAAAAAPASAPSST